MTLYLLGLVSALAPIGALCVWLDRRDASRDRVRRRVDQTPAPLPGAYEPRGERSLPGARTHVFVDGEVT